MATTNPLAKPINVFSIPPELLSNLAVRTIHDERLDDALPENHERQAGSSIKAQGFHTPSASLTPLGSLRCQTCPNAAFDTPDDQREHFKSDWHRYNAKARLTGRAVTAEEWEEMVEGVSSISGSASSSSSGSSRSQTQTTSQSKVTRLLARQHLGSAAPSEGSEEAELADRKRRAILRTAIIWFQSSSPLDALGIPKDTQFGVYRALFSAFDDTSKYTDGLKTLQLPAVADVDEERRITLLMVAGGHFAGMVVGLRPLGKSERQSVKGAGEVRVLQHKTFHRYTTRRKQGGSQGLNDNAKSKANSAGAMLRRYGEQALQDDIRALMKEWEEDIESSEKVFIRASTHGKKSFWGYDGAVIDKSDERIRVFPFPTRRPTLQELLRCWHELTRVKVSHLSQEALTALDDAYIKSLQPKTQPQPAKPVPAPTTPAPVVPKISPEEEAKRDRLRRIDEMIRKGRLEPLQAFHERHAEDFTIEHLGTAAATGQEEIIRFLLLWTSLDPASPLESGKRAYDLASTKGVRNVFRRVAFEHPEKYDWVAAHVPSGLSEEAEAAQEKKKVDRRKGLREKMKERQAQQANGESIDEDQVVEPPKAAPVQESKGPQRLGGARVGAGDGLAGLSGDMRAQIERERRARAAEARFKTSA